MEEVIFIVLIQVKEQITETHVKLFFGVLIMSIRKLMSRKLHTIIYLILLANVLSVGRWKIIIMTEAEKFLVMGNASNLVIPN